MQDVSSTEAPGGGAGPGGDTCGSSLPWPPGERVRKLSGVAPGFNSEPLSLGKGQPR